MAQNQEEYASETNSTDAFEVEKVIDVLGIPVRVTGKQTPLLRGHLDAEAYITDSLSVLGGIDSNTGLFTGANYNKGPFQGSATLQEDKAILKAALRGNLAEIRGGFIKEGDSDQRTVGASFRVPNTPISFSVDQSKYKNPYGQEKVTEAQGIFSLPKKGQIAAFFNKSPYQSTKGIKGGFNLPENWTASGSMQRTDPAYREPFYNAEGQLTKTFKDNTIATLIATHGPIESAKILLKITKPLN